MPNVIGCKLRFMPVDAFGIGYRHDGRIVDQSVNGLRIANNLFTCFTDLLLRAKIELEKSSGDA